MLKSIGVCTCTCSSKYTEKDLLFCAPCPPPYMTYDEFRDHALSRYLKISSICVIAKRCNINGIDDYDCPPETWLDVLMILFVISGVLIIALFIIIIFRYTWKRRQSQNFYSVENDNRDVELYVTCTKETSAANLQGHIQEINERDDISEHESSGEIYYPAEENLHSETIKPEDTLGSDSPDVHRHLIPFNEQSHIDSENTKEKLLSTNQNSLRDSDPSSEEIFEDAFDDPIEYQSFKFIDSD